LTDILYLYIKKPKHLYQTMVYAASFHTSVDSL